LSRNEVRFAGSFRCEVPAFHRGVFEAFTRYGRLIAWARQFGAMTAPKTLGEEKTTGKKLTSLAEVRSTCGPQAELRQNAAPGAILARRFRERRPAVQPYFDH
jgi:hypothetical protein